MVWGTDPGASKGTDERGNRMNKVVIVGHITKDIELRYTQKGTAVCDITVAVRRVAKQENGPNADFIRCRVWGARAENLSKYMGKGSQVGVSGRIESRKYESNGTTKYITEVVADEVEFLSSSKKAPENVDMDDFTPLEDEDDLPF